MSDDKINIAIGSYWHWKHEPELSLIYQGKKGYWHQFSLADDTTQKVWCEVSDKDLILMELDPPKPPTVTISRESAKIARSKIQETLGQSERFYAGMPDSKMTRGEFNQIMAKEIAAVDELTKAMEVKGE